MAAVLPVVSSGIGVNCRGQGAEIRSAQSDLVAGQDEPRGDVVKVRVDLARNATVAHEADT